MATWHPTFVIYKMIISLSLLTTLRYDYLIEPASDEMPQAASLTAADNVKARQKVSKHLIVLEMGESFR
jgi:hypothetical protein